MKESSGIKWVKNYERALLEFNSLDGSRDGWFLDGSDLHWISRASPYIKKFNFCFNSKVIAGVKSSLLSCLDIFAGMGSV